MKAVSSKVMIDLQLLTQVAPFCFKTDQGLTLTWASESFLRHTSNIVGCRPNQFLKNRDSAEKLTKGFVRDSIGQVCRYVYDGSGNKSCGLLGQWLVDDEGGFVFMGRSELSTRDEEAEELLNRLKLERQHAIQSEEQFRALFEHASDGIIIADVESRRFVLVNRRMCEMTGYEPNEILQIGVEQLHPSESLGDVIAAFEKQSRGDLKLAKVLPVLRKDGTVFMADIGAAVVKFDGKSRQLGIFHDITHRLTAEQEQRDHSQFLSALINTIPSPVFHKDSNGVYQVCNRAFADLIIGLPQDKIVGRTVFDLSDVLPKDLAIVYDKADKKPMERGGAQNYEAQVQCADGVRREFAFHKAVVTDHDGNLDGIIGVMLDISERKQAENELKDSEKILRTTLECVPVGIMLVDAEDHKVKMVNDSLASLFGASNEEIVGRPCYNVVCTTSEGNCPVLDRGLDIHSAERCFVTADKREIPVLKTVVQVELGGKLHLLEALVDIRERKDMEARSIQSKKMEGIGQLAAGLAHEINTPLQYASHNITFLKETVEAFAELMSSCEALTAKSEDGSELTSQLGGIVRRIEELDVEFLLEEAPQAIAQTQEGMAIIAKIIAAMKEFSHTGGGEQNQHDINRALENAVAVAKHEWHEHADVIFELDSDLPSVLCYVDEVNNALLGLVINAAQAICDDPNREAKGRGRIHVSSCQNDDWIEIRISDDGSGIDEQHREKVFNPFFTTRDEGQGFGQGLSVAHNVVVEQHKGSIEFKTEVGKGTEFLIRLPLD